MNQRPSVRDVSECPIALHWIRPACGCPACVAGFIGWLRAPEATAATEQLVLSDAVDNSVASIDFRPLAGKKVYLDTSYLRMIKGVAFVNADYVISALRQQIVAAGCLIQDAAADANVIVEARVGVLGSDDHLMTFGVPETQTIVAASSIIPGAPRVPSIPEIAVARRETRQAAAKVIAFAYDRETREPLWQSGVNRAVASANDTWILGMGPFQTGSVRKRTKLAGDVIDFGDSSVTGAKGRFFERPLVDYTTSSVPGGLAVLITGASAVTCSVLTRRGGRSATGKRATRKKPLRGQTQLLPRR